MNQRHLSALARTGRITALDVDAEADAYDLAAGRLPEGKALAMRQAASRMRAAAAEVRAAAQVPSTLAGLVEEEPG